MKFAKIILLIAILSASWPTQALTVGDYKDGLKRKSEYVDIYILGVGQGTFWANAVNQNKNSPPLYCQPGKLTLNLENYKKAIEDELDKYPEVYKDNIPVEIVLIKGLERTFPCEG